MCLRIVHGANDSAFAAGGDPRFAFATKIRIDGRRSVIDNVKLPTCEATWLRDHVTVIASDIAITGNDDTGVCR